MDTSLTGQRVCSYIQGAPETTAYFDAGFWGAGAGTCLRDLGYEPGQLLMGMFDIVEIVLDEISLFYVLNDSNLSESVKYEDFYTYDKNH